MLSHLEAGCLHLCIACLDYYHIGCHTSRECGLAFIFVWSGRCERTLNQRSKRRRGVLYALMAFRAISGSSSRLNTQRQPSGTLRDFVEDGSQLAALPVQRRRPSQGRLKRAGSLGKFEKKGHYEACGTVKLLLAAAQTVDVTYLEQAFLAEVRGHSALDWPDWLFRPCDSLCVQTLAGI